MGSAVPAPDGWQCPKCNSEFYTGDMTAAVWIEREGCPNCGARI